VPKYFASQSSVKDGFITLKGADAAHLGASLRASQGDEVLVSDGNGTDYNCVIARIDLKNKEVFLEIESSCPNLAEPRIKATVYQGIPKGDKLELAVQKSVELGAAEIVPVLTEWTVGQKGPLSANKQARLESVSEAAAKQSMRGIIPRIGEALAFKDAIADSARLEAVFAAYESEKQLSLRQHLKSLGIVGSIGFFIGPEGGFSPKEMSMFKNAGIASVSLGPRILRSETAPLAVLSCIFYEFGDLGVSDG
jgi:16S rRNA (uracil1498-N3)-methyltransferase